MNIQRVKKLTKIVSVLSFMFYLLGCKAQKGSVVEIITCIEIIDTSYNYSKESELSINGKVYSVRQKAFYDLDGKLEKLIIYKADGEIEYDKEELSQEETLLEYTGLPLEQQLYFNGNSLMDEDKEIVVHKISDTILKSVSNGVITLYKLK